jgi:hypothetical protein
VVVKGKSVPVEIFEVVVDPVTTGRADAADAS